MIYQPRLDAERDREIIGMLPSYFAEELMFDESALGLFFWRMLNYLQKSDV